MPTYRITDPASGKTIRVTGPQPPDEATVRQMFAQVNQTPPTQPAPAQSPAAPQPEPFNGMKAGLDAAMQTVGFGIPADVQRGVVKGMAKTGIGIADLAATGLRQIPGVRNYVPDEATFDAARARVEPTNTQQKIGQGIEQAAEFFVPGAALGKLKAAAKTGVGLLDALIGAAAEGTSAGLVQSAQQGTTEGATTTAGVAGVAGLGAQGVVKPLGWIGQRIENALVKPTQADIRDGFKVANIFKHKLGGSLTQSYDKVDKAIADTAQQVKTYANISNQLGRKVNLQQAMNAVEQELAANTSRNFGQNQALQSAVAKLKEDPAFVKAVANNGDVDISTAIELRQAMGDLGAWMHDPSGKVLGADAKAMETVANALYAKLKAGIEQQAIGPIRALNMKLSEIIPIKHAIIRRIPVEQRQNVMSLTDVIALSGRDFGLSLAGRVLKSGRAANAMVNTAEGTTGTGTARMTGAGLSQANTR